MDIKVNLANLIHMLYVCVYVCIICICTYVATYIFSYVCMYVHHVYLYLICSNGVAHANGLPSAINQLAISGEGQPQPTVKNRSRGHFFTQIERESCYDETSIDITLQSDYDVLSPRKVRHTICSC